MVEEALLTKKRDFQGIDPFHEKKGALKLVFVSNERHRFLHGPR
jgi:hypothetical protein